MKRGSRGFESAPLLIIVIMLISGVPMTASSFVLGAPSPQGSLADVPSAPLDVGAELVGNNILLTWDPPILTGVAPILGYQVWRGIGQSSITFLMITTGTYLNDEDIELGKRYCYSVCAFNQEGEGPLSETISVLYVTVPGPPRNLTASYLESKVRLTWLEPESDGGMPVQCYSLVRTTDQGYQRLQISYDLLHYDDTDIIEGQWLNYTLMAINAMGESPAASATVMAPYRMAEPRNLIATTDNGEVVLTWNPPDGSVPSYYSIFRDDGPGTPVHHLADALELSYVDRGLVTGRFYSYEVRCAYAGLLGPAANISIDVPYVPSSVPDAPVDLNLSFTDSIVFLTWNHTNSEGQGVTQYRIYQSLNDGQISLKGMSSANEFTDPSVRPGDNVTYWVSAVNMLGESDFSNPVKLIVPAPTIRVPDAPSMLTSSFIGESNFLNWSLPLDTGTSPLMGFNIYRDVDNGTKYLMAIVQTNGYFDDGLIPGHEYHYWVSAFSDAGEGDMAGPITSMRPIDRSLDPSLVRSVHFQVDGSLLIISWTSPVGEVIGYNIFLMADDGGVFLYSKLPVTINYLAIPVVASGMQVFISAIFHDGDGSVLQIDCPYQGEVVKEETQIDESGIIQQPWFLSLMAMTAAGLVGIVFISRRH